jgi:hypothetical protein
METNTLYKVKRLGLAVLAALALIMTGCENPAVWDGDAESRSVTAGNVLLDPVVVEGTLNTAIDPVAVHITLASDFFIAEPGDDASSWFNLPAGLSASVTSIGGSAGEKATVTLTGKPKVVSSFYIQGEIPGSALESGNFSTITGSATAVYNIRWPYNSWDHSQVFPKGAVNCSTYGEGLFVVGNRQAGDVAYSQDNGRTWTIVSLWVTNAADDWVSSVVYIDDAFYAGGNYGMLASSPDGVNWTIIGAKLLNGEDIRTIAYGNGLTIIGGTNGQTAQTTGYPTASSPWTPVSIFGTTDTINSIAFGADTGGVPLFVATAQGSHSAYLYPSVGIWEDTSNQTAAIFYGTTSGQTSIKMVAYDPNNHKFVAVGFHKAAYVVPTPSSNGFTWVPVELSDIMGATARTAWLNCVTFGGGYFVAGGSNGQTISSNDGINWAITGVEGEFPLPGSDIPFANTIVYNPDEKTYLVSGGFDDGPGIAAYNINNPKIIVKGDPKVIVK